MKICESSKQRNRMDTAIHVALKVLETDKSSSQWVCVRACVTALTT
jgi:hypothetical protein